MKSSTSDTLKSCADRLASIDDDAVVFPAFAFRRVWGVELLIDVLDSETGEPRERYRVRGRNPCEFRLFDGPMTPVVYTEDHVVLADALERKVELTFYGRPRSPREVVGALYMAHAAWCDGWLPFGRYLREGAELLEVLASGYGQIAVGPLSFAQAMAEVLESYELRPAVVHLGGSRPPAPRPTALLLGRNFVWGTDLQAEPIDPWAPIALV